jgi:hypothetical protein
MAMNDVKRKPAGDSDLPFDRVEWVGEYFKSLFVRWLTLGLDDGMRERPWEAPPAANCPHAAPGAATGERADEGPA